MSHGMSKKPTSINVRLGEELLHEVRISAAHNGHSMNAEMIRLVRLALKENPPGTIHTSESVPPFNKEELAELMRLFEKAYLRTRDAKP